MEFTATMDPLPSLETKTLVYWNTSTAFHGKPSQTPDITTGQCLKACGDNMTLLGPHRLLLKKVTQLQDQIIEGRSRRKPKNVATVLHLPAPKRAAGI